MKGKGLLTLKLYFPKNAWVLALTSALWGVGQSVGSPFQSLYYNILGTPLFYIGVLAAFSSIATAIAYALGGYVSDIVGRRKIIVIFSFVSVFSSFVYVVVGGWTWLLVPIMIGALSGVYTPALNATLNDSMWPSLRPVGFASYTILTTIPAIFAPYFGGILIDKFGVLLGLRIAFVLAGIFGTIAISWRALHLQETYVPKVKRKLSFKSLLNDTVKGYISAYKESHPAAKKLLLYSGLSSIATGLSTVFISLYLIYNLHLNPSQYGFLVGISSVVTIALLLPTIALIKRIKLKKAAVLSALSSPLSMLVFVSATGMNDLVAWSVTGGVSGALIAPTIQSLQGDSVSQKIRGRFMALFSIIPLLISVPADIISGYLYSNVSPLSTFLLAIPFYIASILVLVSLKAD